MAKDHYLAACLFRRLDRKPFMDLLWKEHRPQARNGPRALPLTQDTA